ncbi:E3 ubiquitin-protein ligase AIRP2-like isoform X1 [Phoenix dactylifera]|uniref:E3 ubiquitin-protein ligase AIRP2-like isoform X1 n=1 Tax=Phoenix dactylifera TaxID=42345 RepID=A0A8B9ACS2_PHODC|nr:E3 ubiquitin-protein ligase AIRP2-like isoform X1 [Phoenix dactylifera]
MFQSQLSRSSSFRGSLKALEADIHHANTLLWNLVELIWDVWMFGYDGGGGIFRADTIQRAYGGACLQMKLSYSPLAPFFLFLIQWIDCSCSYSLPSYLGLLHILVYKVYADGQTTISTYERRASLRQFYAVIYPSLQQLESYLVEKDESEERGRCKEIMGRKRMEEWRKLSDRDMEREDECGICLEICTKMVLPNCNHAMCINCYRDWHTRSQSCPFCRGSLKRVRSRDLWVLTSNGDVVDTVTLEKENVAHFYRYIDSLPLTVPDSLFLFYYDYLV